MSEDANKALVRRFIEHGYQQVMRGDLDVVHQYYADNYVDHTSLHPEHSGVHSVKELIADTGQATPDLTMKIMHIAADGDYVFAHWRAVGTHTQQHKLTKHVRDVAPTGTEGTASGISLYRIEGGKFVEGWFYHNVLEYALAQAQAQG
jgi:predicted SnoaL-like aldol condensation-catalyzing enzyme